MPKIAEIKEIDGELWARLDITQESPIHILTQSEIESVRRDERLLCWSEITKMVKDDIAAHRETGFTKEELGKSFGMVLAAKALREGL